MILSVLTFLGLFVFAVVQLTTVNEPLSIWSVKFTAEESKIISIDNSTEENLGLELAIEFVYSKDSLEDPSPLCDVVQVSQPEGLNFTKSHC